MPAQNELGTPRPTAEPFNFARLGLVQDAILKRYKQEQKTLEAAQERAKVEALMPDLKTAVVDLLNASIVATQPTGNRWNPATNTHSFKYSFLLGGDNEPYKIYLFADNTGKPTNKPDIVGIRNFVIDPPDGDERLSTECNPVVLEHNYEKDQYNRNPKTRAPKDSDIISFTNLVNGLRQGIVEGSVKVRNRNDNSI